MPSHAQVSHEHGGATRNDADAKYENTHESVNDDPRRAIVAIAIQVAPCARWRSRQTVRDLDNGDNHDVPMTTNKS